ncbi:S1 RNA-binding domain-containing protein [Thermocrinis sp.]
MGELEKFENLLETKLGINRTLKKGEVVKGRIVKIDERVAYIDVDYKVEAVMPREELPSEAKEGDEIKGVLVKFSRGVPVLSFQRYLNERLYGFLKSAYEKGKVVEGRIEEVLENEYIVNVSGVKATLPKSEARPGLRKSSRVVAKIKELSISKDNFMIVLTEKDLLEHRRKKKKEQVLKNLKVGDVVDGKVIKIDPEKGITLLVKNALRAFLPKEELSWGRDKNPYNYTEVGERLKVKVKRIPKDGEFIFVSLRELKGNPWEKATELISKGQTLSGKVIDITEKGVLVEVLEGVEGFVPKDEVSYDNTMPKKWDTVNVKVLEFEPKQRRLILSIKRTLPKPWEEYLKKHPVGSRVKGKVEKLEGASAVIDLGEIKGIIHRSDLSWLKPNRVEEVLTVGEERDFAVLGLEGRYIKLGIKQLQENPWDSFVKKYKVGDKVKLRVNSIHPFGAFLEFPEGIEGLLPLSEIENIKDIKVGNELEVRIIDITPNSRVTLSAKEEKKTEEIINEGSESGFTLGELLKRKMKL